MELPRDAMLLRIFFGQNDKYKGQPLRGAIVFAARDANAVPRGPVGFGKSSRLDTTQILRLSEDLRLIIEIVDHEEAIKAFPPTLKAMMGSGLATLEKAQAPRYGAGVKHALA
jgi:PII-like signaling protein